MKQKIIITTIQKIEGEKIIERVLELLKAKHDAYKSEPYCYYVVKGEDENECDSEEYCESCIEKAVKEFEARDREAGRNNTFSYRYYQMDSRTSCEICDNCGIIIDSCVTADEQEVEHLEDNIYELNVHSMDKYEAHQLYEIMQFAHQCENYLTIRLWKLAGKIIEYTQRKRKNIFTKWRAKKAKIYRYKPHQFIG